MSALSLSKGKKTIKNKKRLRARRWWSYFRPHLRLITLATKSSLTIKRKKISKAIKRKKRSKACGLWSDLYPDLLREIIKHLDIIDVIRCRAVCVSWRSIPMKTMKKDPRCLCCFQTKQPDRLLEYCFNLPEVLGHRCIASSRGFLITTDSCGRISAVNLFTRASFILVPAITSDLSDVPHPHKWVMCHDACRSVIVAKENVVLVDLYFNQANIPTSIDAITISTTAYVKQLMHPTRTYRMGLNLCLLTFAKAGEDSSLWRLVKIRCMEKGMANIVFHEGCIFVLRLKRSLLILDLGKLPDSCIYFVFTLCFVGNSLVFFVEE